jgi:hypothetical protein
MDLNPNQRLPKMSAILIDSASRARSHATSARGEATRRWAGRILSGIAILFLTFDVVMKFMNTKAAVAGTVQLGVPAHLVPVLGIIGAVCLVLYVIPRTAPLGAILWTGYFGGAIAIQLRVENPLFSYTLFPIYVAAIMWGGLYLRDDRVRALLRSAR